MNDVDEEAEDGGVGGAVERGTDLQAVDEMSVGRF